METEAPVAMVTDAPVAAGAVMVVEPAVAMGAA
eukprot:CAMPEP_0117519740 /NCGR_PEP_ID=MMETSP0784-20121206/32807_1 /TAXON_ID=39447 /ORGANISM="" /LENGTH=32 /DNA_ID= /DNA_START= /DNA_END= /DNA_ORIENTATION=